MMQRRDNPDFEARRVRARRTAWIIAAVAIAIFAFSIIEAVVRR